MKTVIFHFKWIIYWDKYSFIVVCFIADSFWAFSLEMRGRRIQLRIEISSRSCWLVSASHERKSNIEVMAAFASASLTTGLTSSSSTSWLSLDVGIRLFEIKTSRTISSSSIWSSLVGNSESIQMISSTISEMFAPSTPRLVESVLSNCSSPITEISWSTASSDSHANDDVLSIYLFKRAFVMIGRRFDLTKHRLIRSGLIES